MWKYSDSNINLNSLTRCIDYFLMSYNAYYMCCAPNLKSEWLKLVQFQLLGEFAVGEFPVGAWHHRMMLASVFNYV